MLADGVLARPKALRHRIADEDDPFAPSDIGISDLAAAQQWNAHGPQVSRRNRAHRDVGLLRERRRGFPLDRERLIAAAAHGKTADHARGIDSGKLAHALENPIIERIYRRRVLA